MTYLMTTHGTGDPDTFRKVSDKVTPQADGLIAVYAGTTQSGMAITSVWRSKAHSDRFTTEVLLPALAEVHGQAPDGPPALTVEFDAFYEHVSSAA